MNRIVIVFIKTLLTSRNEIEITPKHSSFQS